MIENRLEKLLELIKLNPHDPFLIYAVALEYISIGRLEDAKLNLEFISASIPDYLPVYYQLGKLYEMLNENENALLMYQRGVETAKIQNELKTLQELNQAIEQLEED